MARLTARDLTKFPQIVAETIAALVNEYGVNYRKPDGSHILLYNGDRSTRPFKVSASRPAEQTMLYLTTWITANVPEYLGNNAVADPQSVPEGYVDAPEPDEAGLIPAVFRPGRPEERLSEWIMQDVRAGRYVCKCGKWESRQLKGAHVHEQMHTGKSHEVTAKGNATRAARKAAREAEAKAYAESVENAMSVLNRHFGTTPDTGLAEELEKVRAERDELAAQLALIKEAVGL